MVAALTVAAIVAIIVLVRVFNNVYTGHKWYDNGNSEN